MINPGTLFSVRSASRARSGSFTCGPSCEIGTVITPRPVLDLLKRPILPLIAQLAVPMLRYRLSPTRANLSAAVAALHSDQPSE